MFSSPMKSQLSQAISQFHCYLSPDMAESFYILFGLEDLHHVPLNLFLEFRKFCTVHADLSFFFERVDQAALNRFSVMLMEAITKLVEDFVENYQFDDGIIRRTKLLIHIFMHLAGKSPRFLEVAASHSIGDWTMMMRLDFLRTEALMALTVLCRPFYRLTMAENTLTMMLSDLATWHNQASMQNDQRHCIMECFRTLLETEYLFLHQCHNVMDKDSFLDVLLLTETLITDQPSHSAKKRVTFEPSNVRFCVDYFEQLDREFAEVPLEFLFRAQVTHVGMSFAQVHTDIGLRMFLLASTISAAALCRPDYDDALHDEQRAIRLICGVFKVLLEVEEIRRRELEAQKATAHLSRQRSHASSAEMSSKNKKPLGSAEKTSPPSVKAMQPLVAPVIGAEHIETSANKRDENGSNFEPTVEANVDDKDENDGNEANACTSTYTATTGKTISTMAAVSSTTMTTAPAIVGTSLGTKATSIAVDSTPATGYLKSSNQLRLVLLKRQIAANVAASMREACVRAIGNLCTRSMKNQLAAGIQLNAISMLLRCVMKVDVEKPVIPQKATHALRMLCADCPENQERLLAALDLTGNIVDRTQLLANIGFKAEIDEETGKIHLSALPSKSKISPSSSSTSSSPSSNDIMEEEDEDTDLRVSQGNDGDDEEEDEEEDESHTEASASGSGPDVDDERRVLDTKRKRQRSDESSSGPKRSKSAGEEEDTSFAGSDSERVDKGEPQVIPAPASRLGSATTVPMS